MSEARIRIIYDSNTGTVEKQTFIYQDETSFDKIPEYKCVDLPLDSLDHTKSYVESIDPKTGNPVIKDFPPSNEQKRIRELEDALLLQADSETGGIL